MKLLNNECVWFSSDLKTLFCHYDTEQCAEKYKTLN